MVTWIYPVRYLLDYFDSWARKNGMVVKYLPNRKLKFLVTSWFHVLKQIDNLHTKKATNEDVRGSDPWFVGVEPWTGFPRGGKRVNWQYLSMCKVCITLWFSSWSCKNLFYKNTCKNVQLDVNSMKHCLQKWKISNNPNQ